MAFYYCFSIGKIIGFVLEQLVKNLFQQLTNEHEGHFILSAFEENGLLWN